MSQWLFRCIPGISSLTLIVLLFFALVDVEETCPSWICRSRTARSRISGPQPKHAEKAESSVPSLTLAQKIFIFYALVAHVDTFLFALRLCISTLTVRRGIKATLRRRLARSPSSSPRVSVARRDSHPSVDVQPNTDQTVCQDDTSLAKQSYFQTTDEVIHAIIIPNYKEDIDTLRATLTVLASHARARSQYEIYLAMEQSEPASAAKAASLIAAFEQRFLAMHFAVHPNDIPGEMAGKSSNVAFTARKVFEIHRWNKYKEDVIITVIDSDTHLLQDYFTEIRRAHFGKADSWRSLYVCPIVFDRNSHDTNFLVRTADIIWAGVGLAGYLPWAAVHIPTSVYSLPLPLAEQVGGWDAGPDAIGEDMHMLLKSYFSSRNGLVTVPIFSPASQCNISAGGPASNGFSRALTTISARYRQALRHMWGSLDFGYSVRRALQTRRFRLSHIPLFHLLWEAHILPTHFLIMLIASTFYLVTRPASAIHPVLLHALHLCAMLRNFSFGITQLVITVYNGYHDMCVEARVRDMQDAGINEMVSRRPGWGWSEAAERICVPIVALVYGAVPSIQAQLGHFWTDRLVYRVSGKPVFGVAV